MSTSRRTPRRPPRGDFFASVLAELEREEAASKANRRPKRLHVPSLKALLPH